MASEHCIGTHHCCSLIDEDVRPIDEDVRPGCSCYTCDVEDRGHHMIVCEHCGNKRCPHAEWHEYACTGSNEPGQFGAWRYPAAGKDLIIEVTDDEVLAIARRNRDRWRGVLEILAKR